VTTAGCTSSTGARACPAFASCPASSPRLCTEHRTAAAQWAQREKQHARRAARPASRRDHGCGLVALHTSGAGRHTKRCVRVQGLPALAISLDDTRARDVAAFRPAARATAALVKARFAAPCLGHGVKPVPGPTGSVCGLAASMLRNAQDPGGALMPPCAPVRSSEVCACGCLPQCGGWLRRASTHCMLRLPGCAARVLLFTFAGLYMQRPPAAGSPG